MSSTSHPRFSYRGRIVLCGLLMFAMAGCGGGNSRSAAKIGKLPPVSTENAPRFAAGPIGTACNIHNRRGSNAQKCGCIQAAANLTLTQQEQQRAVRFFAEPEILQRIKLSDTPENERFWYAWARFAETAEELCEAR